MVDRREPASCDDLIRKVREERPAPLELRFVAELTVFRMITMESNTPHLSPPQPSNMGGALGRNIGGPGAVWSDLTDAIQHFDGVPFFLKPAKKAPDRELGAPSCLNLRVRG